MKLVRIYAVVQVPDEVTENEIVESIAQYALFALAYEGYTDEMDHLGADPSMWPTSDAGETRPTCSPVCPGFDILDSGAIVSCDLCAPKDVQEEVSRFFRAITPDKLCPCGDTQCHGFDAFDSGIHGIEIERNDDCGKYKFEDTAIVIARMILAGWRHKAQRGLVEPHQLRK